jgi:DDE superfamily endonuclease
MGNARSDWEDELERWLKPFLDRLGHKARRRMCPRYVAGLERKSIQPIAERFAAGDYDQLHHFIKTLESRFRFRPPRYEERSNFIRRRPGTGI